MWRTDNKRKRFSFEGTKRVLQQNFSSHLQRLLYLSSWKGGGRIYGVKPKQWLFTLCVPKYHFVRYTQRLSRHVWASTTLWWNHYHLNNLTLSLPLNLVVLHSMDIPRVNRTRDTVPWVYSTFSPGRLYTWLDLERFQRTNVVFCYFSCRNGYWSHYWKRSIMFPTTHRETHQYPYRFSSLTTDLSQEEI